MIHMMIVDDEERARVGIRNLIDWKDHGISISGVACDGEEALEKLKVTHIDILLTDIQMPVMDGLQLIEEVVMTYPHIRCVIMSGYDNFSYARKALSLGAKDYLLKPSRRKEILETVLHLVEDIKEEQGQTEKLVQLKDGFRESLSLLKEKTLSMLVLNNQFDRRLEANLLLNEIHFPHLFFGILICQIDNLHALQQKFSNEDIVLYKFALKNIVEETIRPSYVCAAFEHEDDIIVIVNAEAWIGVEELTPLVNQVQHNVLQYIKFTVSVGIGSFGQHMTHLRASFSEAATALSTRYFVGESKIVHYVDEETPQSTYPLQQEKAILQAITGGNRDEIVTRLGDFFSTLRPDSASKDQVLKTTFSMFFALYRYCTEKNLNTNEVFGHELIELTRILAHSSMEYIRQVLSETVLKIHDQLISKKNSNKLFESVLAYIQLNYRKDLSRETVASEVYITPGYLSHLFRQNLNTNFVEYLHKIRIEQAYELLRDKGLRISDVAHDVGYHDEKYFFQVFKKYTGITPNQFRNQIQDSL
jgi:two-component system response regulator YesN